MSDLLRYRGNGASVLRVVPYAAFHFAAYEQYRNIIAKHVYGVNDVAGKQMPPTLDLLAGSAAGATAVLLTYPLDLVRTKLAYDPGTGTIIVFPISSSQTEMILRYIVVFLISLPHTEKDSCLLVMIIKAVVASSIACSQSLARLRWS